MMLSSKMMCILLLVYSILEISHPIETKKIDSKIYCTSKSNDASQTSSYKCQLKQDTSGPTCKFQELLITNFKMLFCLRNEDKNEKLYIELYQLQGINIYDLTIDKQTLQLKNDINGWFTQPKEIYSQFINNANRLIIDQNGIIKLSVPFGHGLTKTKIINFVTKKRSDSLNQIVRRQISSLKKQNRALTSTLVNLSNTLKMLQQQISKLKTNSRPIENNLDQLTKLQVINYSWNIYNEDGFLHKVKFLQNGSIQSTIRKPYFAFWKLENQGFIVLYNIYRQITCKLTQSFRDYRGKWNLRGLSRQRSSELSQSFFLVQKDILKKVQ